LRRTDGPHRVRWKCSRVGKCCTSKSCARYSLWAEGVNICVSGPCFPEWLSLNH
jgi:hypothetical protein